MPCEELTAYLTPALRGLSCATRVHSVFDHAVNVLLSLGNGEKRMLSLLPPSAFRMPDSLCVPQRILGMLRPETELAFDSRGQTVLMGAVGFHLSDWTGKAVSFQVKPDATKFSSALQSLRRPTGFDRLLPNVFQKATNALKSGAVSSMLGLGIGLTPSFDDAVVGFLCARRSFGLPCPSLSEDALRETAEISARYLRLADAGYFSEALLDAARALADGADLMPSLLRASDYGATSGMDALYGFSIGLYGDEIKGEIA